MVTWGHAPPPLPSLRLILLSYCAAKCTGKHANGITVADCLVQICVVVCHWGNPHSIRVYDEFPYPKSATHIENAVESISPAETDEWKFKPCMCSSFFSTSRNIWCKFPQWSFPLWKFMSCDVKTQTYRISSYRFPFLFSHILSHPLVELDDNCITFPLHYFE